MKFFITYIRFTYHTLAVHQAVKGKPNKQYIFLGLALLTFPMHFLGLLSVISDLTTFSIMKWLDGAVGIVIQFQRGILTPTVALIILVSTLLTYWACISNIEFDNIPVETEKFRFFKNHKLFKAFLFIISGPVFLWSTWAADLLF